MGFGPDGLLYVAVGDEGRGDPANNAQNRHVLWGKILRIDVDADAFPGNPTTTTPSRPAIPSPPAAADQMWALGLRNPWRASFDRLTGDLCIGDVGQARERRSTSSRRAARRRELRLEGHGRARRLQRRRARQSAPRQPGAHRPRRRLPPQCGRRVAVVGGYVHRGEYPGMQGRYLFADFITNRLWSFRFADSRAVDLTEHTEQLVLQGGSFADITSFAQDGRGNLYAVAIGGAVSRLGFGAGSGDAADLIDGGDGNDRLHGGAGGDRISAARATTPSPAEASATCSGAARAPTASPAARRRPARRRAGRQLLAGNRKATRSSSRPAARRTSSPT